MKKVLLGIFHFYLAIVASDVLGQNAPICDYPFCGNAFDVSGNGFHGNVNGAILVEDRFGNPYSAYKFDGLNDEIIVSHDSLFNFSYNQNFSISVWALAGPTQASVVGNQRNVIISKYFDFGVNSTGFPYSIRINNQTTTRNGKVSLFRKGQTSSCYYRPEALSDSLINDSIWHHIVMIRQDSVIQLWIDGILDDVVTDNGTCPTSNNFNLYIGSKGLSSSNAPHFKGLIDDIKIYDYAISPAQVSSLYQDSNICGTVVFICPGDSVLINNKYRNAPGVYLDTLIASNLSDSFIVTHVRMDSTYYNYQSANICQGDTAIWRGNFYMNSGTYYDTTSGSINCDSIHVLELMIDSLNSGFDTISICKGDSVLIGGVYRKAQGVYTEVRQGIVCDTVVDVYLNVKLISPIISIFNNLLYTSYPNGTFQWYDCDNNMIISGANANVYSPTNAGNYALIFNDSGCIDTSLCLYWTPSGINRHQNKSFIISPNPSKDFVNISDPQNELTDIILTDLTGEIYLNSNITSNLTIDVKNLSPGIYIITLYGNKNVFVEKLLVE